MPALALESMLSAGHDGFPPSPAVGPYTEKSFFNGKKVQLLNYTKYAPHTSGRVTHQTDDRITSSGSSTFFLEGKSVCRVGDTISCGDTIAEGSTNTFVG